MLPPFLKVSPINHYLLSILTIILLFINLLTNQLTNEEPDIPLVLPIN